MPLNSHFNDSSAMETNLTAQIFTNEFDSVIGNVLRIYGVLQFLRKSNKIMKEFSPSLFRTRGVHSRFFKF